MSDKTIKKATAAIERSAKAIVKGLDAIDAQVTALLNLKDSLLESLENFEAKDKVEEKPKRTKKEKANSTKKDPVKKSDTKKEKHKKAKDE